MQVNISYTTEIGRTLTMGHVRTKRKSDGIKSLSTSSEFGNRAPESPESTAKVPQSVLFVD